jgi:hypothetical protein
MNATMSYTGSKLIAKTGALSPVNREEKRNALKQKRYEAGLNSEQKNMRFTNSVTGYEDSTSSKL